VLVRCQFILDAQCTVFLVLELVLTSRPSESIVYSIYSSWVETLFYPCQEARERWTRLVTLINGAVAHSGWSLISTIALFFVGKCKKRLAAEIRWHCEVMASSLFYYEGWLHLLLQLRWWLHQRKTATRFHLFAWEPRRRDPVRSQWCRKIPVWNSDRFISTVVLISALGWRGRSGTVGGMSPRCFFGVLLERSITKPDQHRILLCNKSRWYVIGTEEQQLHKISQFPPCCRC